MKKLLKKFKRQPKRPETGGRITNETVAEHRERVLAGGRKFKYPLQYTKRRVLVISGIITLLALVAFVAFFAWNLYGAQSTSQLNYGITKVVPVPVAKVDGEWVRYSDYLSDVRSAIHYLTTKEAINFNSDDGRRQLDYQKRLALTKAIENTYIGKLARQQNITVASKEVDAFVKQQISSNRLGVTEDAYRQIIRDYYDWSFDEYKTSVKQQLLRKKVSAKLDVAGREVANAIVANLQGGDFAAIAKEKSEDMASKGQGGDIGYVSKTGDDPNGLIEAAKNLPVGGISGVLEGVDGFYIIKVLDVRENGDLHLAKIVISYKIIGQKMTELKNKKLIEEYIKIAEAKT